MGDAWQPLRLSDAMPPRRSAWRDLQPQLSDWRSGRATTSFGARGGTVLLRRSNRHATASMATGIRGQAGIPPASSAHAIPRSSQQGRTALRMGTAKLICNPRTPLVAWPYLSPPSVPLGRRDRDGIPALTAWDGAACSGSPRAPRGYPAGLRAGPDPPVGWVPPHRTVRLLGARRGHRQG